MMSAEILDAVMQAVITERCANCIACHNMVCQETGEYIMDIAECHEYDESLRRTA